jgi:hypothetical protein
MFATTGHPEEHEDEAACGDNLAEPQSSAGTLLRRPRDGRKIEHQVGEDHPEAAPENLSPHVDERVTVAPPPQESIDECDHGVQVRAGHGADREDQSQQRGGGRDPVLEQL